MNVELRLLEAQREQEEGVRRGDGQVWLGVSPGCGLVQGHQDVVLLRLLLLLLWLLWLLWLLLLRRRLQLLPLLLRRLLELLLLLLLLLMGVVACVHHPHVWQGGEERGLPLVDRLEPGREGLHLLLGLRGLQGLEVAHAEGGPADPALVEACGSGSSQNQLQPGEEEEKEGQFVSVEIMGPAATRQTERRLIQRPFDKLCGGSWAKGGQCCISPSRASAYLLVHLAVILEGF